MKEKKMGINPDNVFIGDLNDVAVAENKCFKQVELEGEQVFFEKGTIMPYCLAERVKSRRNEFGTLNLIFENHLLCPYIKDAEFETGEMKESVLNMIKGTPFVLYEGYGFILVNKIGVIVCRGLANIVEFLKTIENE